MKVANVIHITKRGFNLICIECGAQENWKPVIQSNLVYDSKTKSVVSGNINIYCPKCSTIKNLMEVNPMGVFESDD